MKTIQPAVVAGLFYPAKPAVLRDTIDAYLRDADVWPGARPRALVAPHAGYRYSGAVAGHAYAALRPWADTFERVAVLAPSHRVAFRGIATSGADAFETPLGEVAVDTDTVSRLAVLPGVVRRDDAFAHEHALDVQLPFLQAVLGEFRLVPLIVGDATREQVDGVVEALVDPSTLIVVSSDLSHYHDYAGCQALDQRTSSCIEQLDAGAIGPQDACGAYPLRGLLEVARRHGWQVRTLDLRNSGDTGGDRDRVVGYGAYAFY
jgi:MEMO1 family protein